MEDQLYKIIWPFPIKKDVKRVLGMSVQWSVCESSKLPRQVRVSMCLPPFARPARIYHLGQRLALSAPGGGWRWIYLPSQIHGSLVDNPPGAFNVQGFLKRLHGIDGQSKTPRARSSPGDFMRFKLTRGFLVHVDAPGLLIVFGHSPALVFTKPYSND